MPLHPFLPDSEIPKALKGKLKFGDRDQLIAIKKLENKLSDVEIDEKGKPTKSLFNISVDVEYTDNFQVWAIDEYEAEQIAKEEFDFCKSDCHIDFNVQKVKKEE